MTFREHIESLPLLTDASRVLVLDLFTCEEIRKGQDVFRRGKPAMDLYFVESGIVREYVPRSANGLEPEVTYRFAGPQEWYYHPDSYVQGTPATASLQAITPARLWSVPKEIMQRLCFEHHDIALQLMSLLDIYLLYFNERCKYFQTRSLSDRYYNLLTRKPYLRDISDKIISTYLNTTPQSISRLRREA